MLWSLVVEATATDFSRCASQMLGTLAMLCASHTGLPGKLVIFRRCRHHPCKARQPQRPSEPTLADTISALREEVHPNGPHHRLVLVIRDS